jgi:hypothetical protein
MPTLLIYICGALLLVKVVFHLLMFDGKQSRADLAIGVKLAIGLLARSSMPNLCFDNPYASHQPLVLHRDVSCKDLI